MFSRRASAEIGPRNQDGGAVVLALIQDEVRVTSPGGEEAILET